jgi:hypothetical protein
MVLGRGLDGLAQSPTHARRGGGAAGATRLPDIETSKHAMRPEASATHETTAGATGGSATPIESHSAASPLQARIARSDTPRVGVSHGSSPAAIGDACAEQHWSSEFATCDSNAAAQHSDWAAAQHRSAAGAGVVARRMSAATTPGSAFMARAHARSSAGVLQQQLEKHCSAVAQPQGLSMQGNGCDRSLPASRLAVADVGLAGCPPPSGSGRPDTTSA